MAFELSHMARFHAHKKVNSVFSRAHLGLVKLGFPSFNPKPPFRMGDRREESRDTKAVNYGLFTVQVEARTRERLGLCRPDALEASKWSKLCHVPCVHC